MVVIIVHGAYGYPEENWFPWLKGGLEKLGEKVFVPALPTPENQTLENWLKVIEDYEKYFDEKLVLVGHSLGCVFILRLLEKHAAKAAFFVAGFAEMLGNKKFDEINKSFFEKEFDWEKIKENCKKFVVLNSDNDPYVPLQLAENFANKLDTKVEVIKGAGHFNIAAGYDKFPLLLEKIKKESEPAGI